MTAATLLPQRPEAVAAPFCARVWVSSFNGRAATSRPRASGVGVDIAAILAPRRAPVKRPAGEMSRDPHHPDKRHKGSGLGHAEAQFETGRYAVQRPNAGDLVLIIDGVRLVQDPARRGREERV